jgi:MOSC domain-containing protein YiiM
VNMGDGAMHRTREELERGLDEVRRAPKDDGVLELIVRRPAENGREVLEVGQLDVAVGLVGDNWLTRGSSSRPDKSAHPDMQLNVMNARAAALVAGEKTHWALAGDQLYVDLDLSPDNLPAGTRLAIGDATIEVTDVPHNGCAKFAARFGKPALAFVNSSVGKSLRLRGLCARVVVPGTIRSGDIVRKLPRDAG